MQIGSEILEGIKKAGRRVMQGPTPGSNNSKSPLMTNRIRDWPGPGMDWESPGRPASGSISSTRRKGS